MPAQAHAQVQAETQLAGQQEEYFRGRVSEILEEKTVTIESETFYIQKLAVIKRGTGETLTVEVGSEVQPLNVNQRLQKGAEVILTTFQTGDGQVQYAVADVFRWPALLWLLAGFLVLVMLVARWQGLLSIIGMMASLALLTLYIVPQILQGENPLMISLIGATAIAVVTVYLSHGFNLHSHLTLVSMMATLVAVALLSSAAVNAAQLVGLGSEEAYFLQFGPTANINLQGLLLGGILLGALGILDDICVAQISTVIQLKAVNKDLGFKELYERGLRVGKDHVASLVNTLVLAYAGANLPLFLLFTLNQVAPWWVTFNNEIIAEEVVRTLVGSMGLVVAVPVATFLAAYLATHPRTMKLLLATAVSPSTHHHHHS